MKDETNKNVILRIKDLTIEVNNSQKVNILDKISFDVHYNDILGIAGESGSGKSTLAAAIINLIPYNFNIKHGIIELKGENLIYKSEKEWEKLRLEKISIVFQSALNSLNPVRSIKKHFHDALNAHRVMKKKDRDSHIYRSLSRVGLSDDVASMFPHELSGGMAQRVNLARALLLEPDILILDEPTTALDVVVQYKILEEIKAIQKERPMAIIFVSHDLPLLLSFCTRMGILYAGKLVELFSVGVDPPQHPYTKALLDCQLPLSISTTIRKGIPSTPHNKKGMQTSHEDEGCSYHPQCMHVCGSRCATEQPAHHYLNKHHHVSCHIFDDAKGSLPIEIL